MQNRVCDGGIAIVDDERSIVDIYSKILISKKIPIAFVAYDGEEAVDKFMSCMHRPKVVLMDFRMPLMNGIEASKRIWKIEPSTRIIFISADSGVKEEAIKAGAAGFIQKPASLREIVVEVECVINNSTCRTNHVSA